MESADSSAYLKSCAFSIDGHKVIDTLDNCAATAPHLFDNMAESSGVEALQSRVETLALLNRPAAASPPRPRTPPS